MEQQDVAASALAEPPRGVPKFDGFSESSGMNRQQKSFYQGVFLVNPFDVDGRPGY